MSHEYRAIALDLDGTVLNSDLEISDGTKKAILDALAAGKEVFFCTGRCYSEAALFLDSFPNMHYLCGESGDLNFDLFSKEVLNHQPMDQELARFLLGNAKMRGLMPVFFSKGLNYADKKQIEKYAYYNIPTYHKTLLKSATFVDDIFATGYKLSSDIEKMLLLHPSVQERQITINFLETLNVSGEFVKAEFSNLECTAPNVTKANGLKALCEKIGLSLEDVIMVGDSDNDYSALAVAGLAIAMGNANQKIKDLCPVHVADNDHDGVAEAIYNYLLK